MTSHPMRNQVVTKIENLKRSATKTVVIGDLDRWKTQGRITVDLQDFVFIDLVSLNAEVLDALQPEIILSPLFCHEFDVVDVATRLRELGFKGRYRAIWQTVPNAAIISTEVRGHAPGLDFDIVLVPAG